MKTIGYVLAFTALGLLAACGGGDEKDGDGKSGGSKAKAKGSTITISSETAGFKEFEMKSSSAVKYGYAFNGKRYVQCIMLAFANFDNIKYNSFFVEMPENDQDKMIVFTLYGEYFEKGSETKPIKPGDFDAAKSTSSDDNSYNCWMYLADGKTMSLLGKDYSSAGQFSGTATITTLTDNLVEGTIDYKAEDGSTIRVKFSENIAKDYWEENFEKYM